MSATYNTYIDYVGDGATTDYALPFIYLDAADVKITVWGVTTPFSFLNANTVRFSPAPPSGAPVRIARSTAISEPRVVFANGSSTTAGQLNTIGTQLIFAMQEAVDSATIGYSTADYAKAQADYARAEADASVVTANTALTTANTANTVATEAKTSADAAAVSAASAASAAAAASASANVHNAADLPYNNSTSHLSATDVQAAIDLIAGASGITALTTDSVTNQSTVTGAKVTDAFNTLAGLIAALAAVARTGAYSDLTGKPTIGTAAQYNVGSAAYNIVQIGSDGKLPALDGSHLTGLAPTSGQITGALGYTPFSNTGGSISGNVNFQGDIFVSRSSAPATGVLYFGNTGSRYLYFDGSSYSMPGANLVVNGSQVWTRGDFTAVPPTPVTSLRAVYAADNSAYGSSTEPYGSYAAVSGISATVDIATGNINGIYVRYRYHQYLYNGGWYNFG